MNRRLGVLGGGQLGRMLALAAHPLGLSVSVLDPNPNAPARAVAQHICADFDDARALAQLADCDWVTFEFENVPDTSAAQLAGQSPVFPPVAALRLSQDRWVEKNAFLSLGIATTKFSRVDSLADLDAAFDELGPLVLKTRRMGYDGKGQVVITERAQLSAGYALLEGASAIAEQLVHFDRELSIVACRSQTGEVISYPLVHNIHKNGVLRTTIAPAPDLSPAICDAAELAVSQLLSHLNYVGVLALELFLVGDRLLANEFAPRVHNSGHWTIEGAETSQFENHVRAVCGLPLGTTGVRSPAVMINLVGSVPDAARILQVEGAHLHDYGKAPRAGRKVGHVTVLGSTLAQALMRSQLVEALLE